MDEEQAAMEMSTTAIQRALNRKDEAERARRQIRDTRRFALGIVVDLHKGTGLGANAVIQQAKEIVAWLET